MPDRSREIRARELCSTSVRGETEERMGELRNKLGNIYYPRFYLCRLATVLHIHRNGCDITAENVFEVRFV